MARFRPRCFRDGFVLRLGIGMLASLPVAIFAGGWKAKQCHTRVLAVVPAVERPRPVGSETQPTFLAAVGSETQPTFLAAVGRTRIDE